MTATQAWECRAGLRGCCSSSQPHDRSPRLPGAETRHCHRLGRWQGTEICCKTEAAHAGFKQRPLVRQSSLSRTVQQALDGSAHATHF